MFLCRRATGLGCKYRWNFAGAAEVGINPPAALCGAGTLQGRLGSAGGLDTCLNRRYTLFPDAKALVDGLCGRMESELGGGMLLQTRSFSMFPSVSVSATAPPQFSSSRFPGINISINTTFNACLCAPEYRILSRASSTSQKEANMEKNAPTTEVNQIKTTDIPQGEKEEPVPDKKLNKTAQLKKVFKEYGAVGVSFHIGISLISLGIFYLAVSSGINMTALLCKLGFSESVVQSKLAAGTSTFVLAYAVHKLFAPLRISITLVSVPLIVRHLRRTGLFKHPPSSL
ncbi:protein FAM210B, mitochondrial [Astyanax mexicanus]|uniref:protein FAM210B, mitochondrial n=1 Tax=Astyanax mexicanus TaxID=7994 RepID=UPI0020CA9D43|nr:protein FAM210B, mitochondrial [Astyanax mexicanus]